MGFLINSSHALIQRVNEWFLIVNLTFATYVKSFGINYKVFPFFKSYSYSKTIAIKLIEKKNNMKTI